MKQAKRKLIKTARKSVKDNLLEKLIAELTKVSANLGTGTDKLQKAIKKGSEKLAKKIAKEIQLDELSILAGATTGAAVKTEAPKPAKTKAVKAPVAKSLKKSAKAETVVTAS